MSDINNQIIFEDNHLLILNKRSGQLVQGDKTGDSPLLEELKTYVKQTYQKQGNVFIGLAHRLDRPCSGVVVFAKTSKALERMNAIFRDGEATKKYWAVSEVCPDIVNGTLQNFLQKNEKQNKSYIVEGPVKKDIKEAILHYTVLGKSERYFLIEIELITGRHHQIRAQLSGIGCPIKGDLKYGASRSNKDGSIHLHALSIQFIHPVKKEEIKITAFPPKQDTLWSLFLQHPGLSFDERNIVVQNHSGFVHI